MDKTQQNHKSRLCGEKKETIDNIISECSKLLQNKYNTRDDWVGMFIHSKFSVKLKFAYTTKHYMPKPDSVQENETYKIFGDFDLQTDQLI